MTKLNAWRDVSKQLIDLNFNTTVNQSQSLADAISALATDYAGGQGWYTDNGQGGGTVGPHPFWQALADKAQLSADHIVTIKSAERSFYGTSNPDGSIAIRGVLDMERDLKVGHSLATRDLNKSLVSAAAKRDRELAAADVELAAARGLYEVDEGGPPSTRCRAAARC